MLINQNQLLFRLTVIFALIILHTHTQKKLKTAKRRFYYSLSNINTYHYLLNHGKSCRIQYLLRQYLRPLESPSLSLNFPSQLIILVQTEYRNSICMIKICIASAALSKSHCSREGVRGRVFQFVHERIKYSKTCCCFFLQGNN